MHYDSNSKKKIRRNKAILSAFVLAILFVAFSYILLISSFDGNLSFRRALHGETGEPLSVISSIMIYLVWLLILGMLPGCALAVLCMGPYALIHRKDYDAFKSTSIYSEEIEFAIGLSVASGYAATFILILLHASGLATIRLY